MDIRAIDVYRAVLRQCQTDVAEAKPHERGRALVDLADFLLSDAPADAVATLQELLETAVPEGDEIWVMPEVARATLDALKAWQKLAAIVRGHLNDVGGMDSAVQELRDRLAEAGGMSAEGLASE